MKTLELKTRLLCEGANAMDDETVESLSEQNPQKVLRGGLSSGLKAKIISTEDQMFRRKDLRKEYKVNFPLYSKIPTALKIKTTEKGLVIIENDEVIGSAEVITPPEWYSQDVDGYPITSILTQHGNQLVGSVYEWCSLFNTGEQCKFCVIDKSQKMPELRKITRKAELIMKALEKIPRGSYQGIGLNGGMTFTEGRGLEVMTPLVGKIRELLGNIPIGVEITPPQDPAFIEQYAEAGGESLMMNLETWDDETRQKLIPGKSKYCSKDSYFKAFEAAVKILGKGKVSTCFVVGTEPMDSLKQGIEKVIDFDVIPSPLAGRYFEQFTDYPFDPRVNWKDFLEIFRFTREQMLKKGLMSSDKAGCISCGMCDVIGDK